MKTIILITSLLCLFACQESTIYTAEVDGCEYVTKYNPACPLTHKANCKNHH